MAKRRPSQISQAEQVELDQDRESLLVDQGDQTDPEATPPEGDDHDVDTGNKASLVRAALARGFTKPRDGVRWIKETYGVEIEGTYFSVAKSQQAKRSGEVSSPRNYSSTQPRSSGGSSSPQGVPTGFGGDVKAIRTLLANHGNEADAVKDLVATIDTLVRKYGVSGLNEMIDAFSG